RDFHVTGVQTCALPICNTLAASIGLAAISLIEQGDMTERSATSGEYLLKQLQTIDAPFVTDIRGQGLWLGIELDSEQRAHDFCEIGRASCRERVLFEVC